MPDGVGQRFLDDPVGGQVAAAILMLSFLSMSTGPQTDLKILATGLGAGILIDAVVIRCLLVPAMVALFGRANWWLPASRRTVCSVRRRTPHTALATCIRRLRRTRTGSAAAVTGMVGSWISICASCGTSSGRCWYGQEAGSG
jgi:hypothetical protein